MRKLVLLMLTTALLVGAVAMPTAAAPQEALTRLADYFPAESVIYAAVRTDGDFIATLETVTEKLNDALPAGAAIPDLSDALDMAAQELNPDGDFASVFGTWLGGAAAIGIPTYEPRSSEQPVIVAIEITDADAAEAFLESSGALETYSRDEQDGYTLLSPMTRRAGQPFVIIRDDVALLSINADIVATGGLQDSPLSATDAFVNTVNLLPESEYNVVFFNDYGRLIGAMMDNFATFESDFSGETAMADMYTDLFAAIGPQAYGATILNERSLTIDLVATYADTTVFEQFGGLTTEGMEPVDAAFAGFIPAGTPLVIMSNTADRTYEDQMEQLNTLFDSFMAQGMLDEDDLREFKQVIFALETGIRGLTGLEPSEVFDWMTGDMALYLGLSPSASDASSLMDVIGDLPVDFAVTLEATDPAAASAVVEGLANGLEDLPAEGLTVSREDINGTNALVFTISGQGMPFEIELLLAANDSIFTFGTRRYVTFALNPGEGLDTDPAYLEAAATLVPNSAAILYLSGAGLQPITDIMVLADDSRSTQREAESLSAVLDLISSASISASIDGGFTYSSMRMVWTLPE